MGSNQSVQRYKMKMTSNGRRPPTEDDLKILKLVECHPKKLVQTKVEWGFTCKEKSYKLFGLYSYLTMFSGSKLI